MEKIGFIGCGNMAEAIIKGLVKRDQSFSEKIFGFDISNQRLSYMESEYGISCLESETEVFSQVDYVFFAIKPQVFPQIKKAGIGKDYKGIIISIMAGVDLNSLREAFPQAQVVRTMPNLPALVGHGVTGICYSDGFSTERKDEIERLLQSIGQSLVIEEKNINALTGLSGSGPAFVFLFAEAMADAGVYCGLSREDAAFLAAATLSGSAQMLLETKEHPGQLKDRVASPAGTTIEGIKALEENSFRDAVMTAVIESYKKAQELK